MGNSLGIMFFVGGTKDVIIVLSPAVNRMSLVTWASHILPHTPPELETPS